MFSMQFTEEQLRVQQMVRDFAEREIAPGAAQRDLDEDYAPAYEIMKKMGKLGLWGLPFPLEYGGAGGDQIQYVLAGLEINKVDASIGCSYSVQVSLAGWPIFYYGNEEQRQEYSTKMFAGEKLGAFGLTEPNAGSDSAMSETYAVEDGNDYIINGTKCFITNSGYADYTVLFAMTDKSRGAKGITAFIVDKETPGYNFTKQEEKMGIRSTVQRIIEIEDMRVHKSQMLGKIGEGFKIAMKTLDGGRIGIAAQGAGIAEGAYEYALNYAKERVQFGKPIAAQQAISFKLADMATKIEAAKLLTLKAGWLKDTGQSYGLAAAHAKKFATDTAMEVTTDAVQILGGAGFLRDHPVERMMRDAKITQIYEGTNEIQNLVIGGYIMR